MISRTTQDFRELFKNLPVRIQAQARQSYAVWQSDSFHPGLHFKPVHKSFPEIWSVRIGRNCRALGLREAVDGHDTIFWYWIGPHSEYDRLLKQF